MQYVFVSNNLGASTRYRVDHQLEQAEDAGIATCTLALESLPRLAALPRCDALYLHRIPLTSRTLPLVAAAKLRRTPIIFDSDDLVWDEREREYNFLDAHYPPGTVQQILRTTRRMRLMMRLADAFVFSTPYLAQRAAQTFRQPAFVNPNALSREQVDLSNAARRENADTQREAVIIGYFSGQAKVHDEDVATISPVLCKLLDLHQQVQLRVFGGLSLLGGLEHPRYKVRIEQRPAVDWRALPACIAQVDINIAPLVDNPQRRSKSAVKYLEAAAVGVPTVAARLEPYELIQHGRTGLLAGSPAEWEACLERLIVDTQQRRTMGLAARHDVLAHHTTTVRAANFADILHRMSRI